MDLNSSAGKLPPVLSVGNLIRGILTLEDSQGRKTLISNQKGLNNLAKAGQIPVSVVHEFKRLKILILEGKTEEPTMQTENMLMEAKDIGLLLYKHGWIVFLLDTENIHHSHKLRVAGYKKFAHEEIVASFIAGPREIGSRKEPPKEYEAVEMLISMGDWKDWRFVDRAGLEAALADPCRNLSIPDYGVSDEDD